MNRRVMAGLLRVYPPAWRSRYGEELSAMIEAESTSPGSAWRIALDVLAGATRQRLRVLELGGGATPGPARARGGVVLVVCSWSLVAIGGAGVQRFSEHWEGLTPPSAVELPRGAFTVLVISGSLGCALLAAGILAALPRLAVFLREGGWPKVRAGTRRAAGLTTIAAIATAGLVLWAHGLDGAARNGGDAAYSAAFLACGALLVASLLAWTWLAASCARHIAPAGRLLALESWLAIGVAVAAIAASTAAVLWWAALAAGAPAVLHGRSTGGGTVLVLPLLLDTTAMALGSVLAAVGGMRCARELAAAAKR